MASTDPIADMLSKIKNASMSKKTFLTVKASKLKLRIVEILKEEGFIANYNYIEDNKQGIIRIYLKYYGKRKEPVITDIRKVSKPGRRIYMPYRKIRSSKNHRGIYIISTSRGVLTDKTAKILGVGGEIICEVW